MVVSGFDLEISIEDPVTTLQGTADLSRTRRVSAARQQYSVAAGSRERSLFFILSVFFKISLKADSKA